MGSHAASEAVVLLPDTSVVPSSGPLNQYCSKTWSRYTGSAPKMVILQGNGAGGDITVDKLTMTMFNGTPPVALHQPCVKELDVEVATYGATDNHMLTSPAC